MGKYFDQNNKIPVYIFVKNPPRVQYMPVVIYDWKYRSWIILFYLTKDNGADRENIIIRIIHHTYILIVAEQSNIETRKIDFSVMIEISVKSNSV